MDANQPLPPGPGPASGAIAGNLAALYAIRIAASVLPLISMPYVVRILGPGGYGVFAFSQGLIGYFNMLIDYGFNLAATRRIAATRHDRAERDRVVSATLAAKLLLALLGFALLLLLTAVLPPLRSARMVALLLYGATLGSAIFPVWLYQGEERMVRSSVLVVAGTVAATAAIFVFVRQPGDQVALGGVWGAAGLLTGIVALAVALRTFAVTLHRPSRAELMYVLRDGMLLSVSAGSTTLYTSGNTFLLGLVAPKEVVGLYAGGEKIVRAVQELVNPIQQALYPRLSALAGRSHALAVDAARRIIGWTAGLGLLLSLGIFIGAPLAVSLLLGPDFGRTVAVVRILSPLPFLVALSSTLTFQLMLPMGRDRALLRVITAAGIGNVLLALLFASRWLERGMALAVLSTEIVVLACIALYLRRRGVHLFDRRRAQTELRALGVAADEP